MNHNIELQASRRKWAIDYLGGCCVRCGSTENLEFDHIDPKTKKFTIGDYLKGRLSNLTEELGKCQLLCKPCHQEKTREEFKKKRTHGKQFLAIKLKCECDVCASFREEYNALRREKRSGNKKKRIRQHGTRAMYLRGCSCDPCNDANNKYMREYNRRRKGT